MHYVEDVINGAKEEIGYFEKATDKDLDEKTLNVGDGHYPKYARDLDNIGFYNTCQNGIRDVFVKCYRCWLMLAVTNADRKPSVKDKVRKFSSVLCRLSFFNPFRVL